MCGIFGIYSKTVVVSPKEIQDGLKKLQYRGYDSWGYYMNKKPPKRFLGKIFDVEDQEEQSNFGIGHTRWATHGEPSERNTHPISFTGKTTVLDKWLVVHNGIITNHEELVKRYQLEKNTDTDTEIIVLLAEYFYTSSTTPTQKDFKKIVEMILSVIEGTYAFVLVSPEYFPDEMIATCKGSPLIICETGDQLIFTSDHVTLPSKSKYVYAKHGDVIHVKNGGYEFSKPKEVYETAFFTRDEDKETTPPYKHHMLKEIIDQPDSLRSMFKGRLLENGNIKLGGNFDFLRRVKNVTLLGCGSSYNACLVARPFIEKNRVVNVELASDFVIRKPYVDTENTAYVIVSQSGETRDCIEACEYISEECSGVCYGINNRPGCLLDSKTIAGIHMNIGTEKSVPATKSFTATIIALVMMIEGKITNKNLPDALESHIQRLLHEENDDIIDENVIVIGDSWGLGLAKEFSLKMQEVAYVKTMWFPGYEMKHGPIALVDESTQVIYYGLSGSQIPNILESRGAKMSHKSEHFSLTRVLCDIVSMQMFVYRLALKKGLPIDTPRNLAKSVTV